MGDVDNDGHADNNDGNDDADHVFHYISPYMMLPTHDEALRYVSSINDSMLAGCAADAHHSNIIQTQMLSTSAPLSRPMPLLSMCKFPIPRLELALPLLLPT